MTEQAILLILHCWSTVLISCFCIHNDLHMVGGRGFIFFAFIILIVHTVHTEMHCIHWNSQRKSGLWLHLLLYSWTCSHPILWLNDTVQSFAFSASYLFDPIVAVAKEAHFLALPVSSLVALVWPWCIPSQSLNIFFSYFVWFSLKRCIGIHDYADSVRGTIKTGNCRTLLKTKQHDITHNRSTDVFLWSHDIISKHRQLLVSNSTLTNQPHNHKFHWLQELHFRLAAFRDKRKASFPSFPPAVTELRAAPGPSHGDCTKSGNVRKILVKDAFPIQSSPRKNS